MVTANGTLQWARVLGRMVLGRADRSPLVETTTGRRIGTLAEILRNTARGQRDTPHLLAPIDLQVIKAAGVTFATSLLERVIDLLMLLTLVLTFLPLLAGLGLGASFALVSGLIGGGALVVLQAAGVPLDPTFVEQKKILGRCRGLFYLCAGGAEARRFNRLLIDAGLIQGF